MLVKLDFDPIHVTISNPLVYDVVIVTVMYLKIIIMLLCNLIISKWYK